MSTYFPLKKGTDVGTPTGLPPSSDRLGGHDPASQGSQEALRNASADVDAWLAGQRQAYANSTVPYHAAQLDHPDVDARYVNHNGQEQLTLSPKPGPQGQPDQPSEAPELPNELPELAQDEPVDEQTPLYLMVLFGLDGIAAVPMDSLATPTAEYVGKCDRTNWSNGQPIQTMQELVAGTQYVMLPLDLTGTVGAKTLWLSTNKLGDAVATDAKASFFPVMNGTEDILYTAGGSYALDRGVFRQQDKPYSTTAEQRYYGDAAPAQPYAFDTDGTSYWYAIIDASCGAATDTALPQDVSLALVRERQDASVDAPVATWYNYFFSINEVEISRDTGSGIHSAGHHFHGESYATIDEYQLGPLQQKGGVCGESYDVVGTFGKAPTVRDYKAALGGATALSWNGSAFEEVTVGAATTDVSLAFPLQNRVVASRSTGVISHLEVMHPQALATISVEPGGRLLATGQAGVPSSEPPQVISYTVTNLLEVTIASDSYYVENDYSFINGISLNTTPKPQIPINTQSVADYYERGVTLFMSTYQVAGHRQRTTDKVTSDDGNVSGPLSGVPDGQPASNYIQVSGSNGSAAVCLGLPVTNGYETFTDTFATMKMFGVTAYFTEHKGGGFGSGSYDSTTGEQRSLAMHTFPPCYDGKTFFTDSSLNANQLDKVAVVTPYATHDKMSTYKGLWHVSNGSHCIQGYRVDDGPHAYLDGDGEKDWLPKLAKVLKCQTTDIVSMVMDVTMAKIKAVARVKPPVYD